MHGNSNIKWIHVLIFITFTDGFILFCYYWLLKSNVTVENIDKEKYRVT